VEGMTGFQNNFDFVFYCKRILLCFLSLRCENELFINFHYHDNHKNVFLPAFHLVSNGKSQIPAITDCDQIYDHLNTILKMHNEQFAQLIVSKIQEYVSSGIKSEIDKIVE
jgi:hypothetical protein